MDIKKLWFEKQTIFFVLLISHYIEKSKAKLKFGNTTGPYITVAGRFGLNYYFLSLYFAAALILDNTSAAVASFNEKHFSFPYSEMYVILLEVLYKLYYTYHI